MDDKQKILELIVWHSDVAQENFEKSQIGTDVLDKMSGWVSDLAYGDEYIHASIHHTDDFVVHIEKDNLRISAVYTGSTVLHALMKLQSGDLSQAIVL